MSESARTASNDFSKLVYWELIANKPNNAVISPFSVHAVLTLASFGAEGLTATTMMTALGIKASEDLLNDYKRLIEPMIGETALTMANKIYFSTEVQLNPTFQTQANSFNIELDKAFFYKTQSAARNINNSMATKTNGKLQGDLVDTANLNAGMKMVLINGLHFKGKWAKPFKPADTKDGPFLLSESSAVPVPMMHIKANFSMYEETGEDGFKVLTLPYENLNEHQFSMHIILPNNITGLATLEKKLFHNDENFGDMFDYFVENSTSSAVDVTVPRFHVENKWDMRDMCKNVGMEMACTEAADFTPTQEDFPEQEEVYKIQIQIGQVVQKAIIEVDEGWQSESLERSNPAEQSVDPVAVFTADHPFLFTITYTPNNLRRSNVILFIGSVHSPISHEVNRKFNLMKIFSRK